MKSGPAKKENKMRVVMIVFFFIAIATIDAQNSETISQVSASTEELSQVLCHEQRIIETLQTLQHNKMNSVIKQTQTFKVIENVSVSELLHMSVTVKEYSIDSSCT